MNQIKPNNTEAVEYILKNAKVLKWCQNKNVASVREESKETRVITEKVDIGSISL